MHLFYLEWPVLLKFLDLIQEFSPFVPDFLNVSLFLYVIFQIFL